MNTLGKYQRSEIKYNIDTVIQKTMYETNKEQWEIILEVQRKLYEEFEIDGWISSLMVSAKKGKHYD